MHCLHHYLNLTSIATYRESCSFFVPDKLHEVDSVPYSGEVTGPNLCNFFVRNITS